MKNKMYISFGQDHHHTVEGQEYDANTLALIYCDSYGHGRELAFEAFDGVFSFSYYNDDYKPEDWAQFNMQIIELNPDDKP